MTSPSTNPASPCLLFWHVPPSLCCHPEEVAVTIVVMHSPSSPEQCRGRNTGIIIIIVIISQMRRAKLELCPSPSGWLTVTHSSLIHPTHQLYTGQRSPERQEAAKASLHVSAPTAAQRHIAALRAQPLSPTSSFSLSENRRQLVIMPLASAAVCGCHVSLCEVKVRSSGQQWQNDKSADVRTNKAFH